MNDITPSELKSRLKNNEKPVIIDVREEWEHQEESIPGAQNIPLGTLADKMDDLEEHKEQEIIVHCRSGARSAAAKTFLMQHGFLNVRNLQGGIMGYKQEQ
ncbi:MAG: rhodanese-like domain-containing protein [Hymenobacteraceae bacterium]|nr:rhodanese-like domain-containing protein [Hymenobacteraceae bacterium]MDX5397559.1 rhodanese-like domain-containing protein [Hymenobacteraceae bacterium]MDX5513639.1 rhodanese-like domain-containing protein [Hymenobacteraceae bacterium]